MRITRAVKRDPRRTVPWVPVGLDIFQLTRIGRATGFSGSVKAIRNNPQAMAAFLLDHVWWWRRLKELLNGARSVPTPSPERRGYFSEELFHSLRFFDTIGATAELLGHWFEGELAARVAGAKKTRWPAFQHTLFETIAGEWDWDRWHSFVLPSQVLDSRKTDAQLAREVRAEIAKARAAHLKELPPIFGQRIGKSSYLREDTFRLIEIIDEKCLLGSDHDFANVNRELRARHGTRLFPAKSIRVRS